MIETTKGRATAFSISVDNREYWITAKHVFTGIMRGPAGEFSTKRVFANILSQNGEGDQGHDLHWVTEQFTSIDPGKDIDILVLVPDHTLANSDRRIVLQAADSKSPLLGGECEFLGFPWGGGWKAKFGTANSPWSWLPYAKRCSVSGSLSDKDVWVLDGINIEGFSGGPVVYNTGPDQRVFAVISGFYQEPLEVVNAPEPGQEAASVVPPPPQLPGADQEHPKKQIVETNSGFIVAFGIQPALDAIRANPIGPLIPEAAPAQSAK